MALGKGCGPWHGAEPRASPCDGRLQPGLRVLMWGAGSRQGCEEQAQGEGSVKLTAEEHSPQTVPPARSSSSLPAPLLRHSPNPPALPREARLGNPSFLPAGGRSESISHLDTPKSLFLQEGILTGLPSPPQSGNNLPLLRAARAGAGCGEGEGPRASPDCPPCSPTAALPRPSPAPKQAKEKNQPRKCV